MLKGPIFLIIYLNVFLFLHDFQDVSSMAADTRDKLVQRQEKLEVAIFFVKHLYWKLDLIVFFCRIRNQMQLFFF